MFNWLKKLFDNTEPEATGVRARTAKGHYVADDKSTPKVNEAYADGKTPVKKAKRVVTKKAPVKKKAAPKKAPAKKGRAKKAPTKK